MEEGESGAQSGAQSGAHSGAQSGAHLSHHHNVKNLTCSYLRDARGGAFG
jgi:hypothetical protein